MAILTGQHDSFKSFIALEAGAAVATGDEFLGQFAVPKTGKALIIQTEIDEVAYMERVAKMIATSPEDAQKALLLWRYPVFTLDTTGSDMTALEEVLAADRDIRLLVLDNVSRMCPMDGEFDENRASHVQPLLEGLRRLALGYRISVIMVHHDSKPGESGRRTARGSSAFENYPDVRIRLERSKDKPGEVKVSVRSRTALAHEFSARFDPATLRLTHSEFSTQTQEDIVKALNALGGYRTVEQIAAQLNQEVDAVRKRAERLAGKGKIDVDKSRKPYVYSAHPRLGTNIHASQGELPGEE